MILIGANRPIVYIVPAWMNSYEAWARVRRTLPGLARMHYSVWGIGSISGLPKHWETAMYSWFTCVQVMLCSHYYAYCPLYIKFLSLLSSECIRYYKLGRTWQLSMSVWAWPILAGAEEPLSFTFDNQPRNNNIVWLTLSINFVDFVKIHFLVYIHFCI